MDDFARALFETAIIKEKAAYNLYIELKNKAVNPNIKKLLQAIADEELIHAELFSKMDIKVLRDVNRQELPTFRISTKDEILKKDDINHILDIAIAEEQKAIDDYSIIINHIPFGEARETLLEIATQESRHKAMLQKMKLEFNGNDWGVI